MAEPGDQRMTIAEPSLRGVAVSVPLDDAFDDLVRLAAHCVRSPIAVICIADGDRLLFKGQVGVEPVEVSRGDTFCGLVIASRCSTAVGDVAADVQYADLGRPGVRVRACAGAPLVDVDGVVFGAVCAFDRVPRAFKPDDLAMLEAIARRVVAHIERRAGLSRLARAMAERARAEAAYEDRLAVERAIARISSRFHQFDDFDGAVTTTLREIGDLARASRSYLVVWADEHNRYMDNTHEWCAPGVAPRMANLQNTDTALLPWSMASIRAGRFVHVRDVSELPAEAAPEREMLEAQGIRSLMAIPVLAGGQVEGFVGLDNVTSPSAWSEEDESLLRLAAELIGSGIERRRMREAAEYSALHDALTGLPNRALFRDRAGMMAARIARNERFRFAVLHLDVDRLSVVNESLGHEAGDALLVALARRLAGCVRPSDTVARLEGDEFGILLDGVKGVSGPRKVAQRIHSALLAPFGVDGQEVFASLSIGIAMNDTTGDSDGVLRDAAAALSRAKAGGRGRVEVFEQSMREATLALLETEAALRRAIERGEMEVFFQPVMSLEDRRITACEALLRWRHPRRGLLEPCDFIPVAEECGLIVPISEWVLSAACSRSREWRDAGLPPIKVSVNIPARHFIHIDLAALVARALADSGLGAGDLQIEMTEADILEATDWTISTLAALHALGVSVSVDDFGTGYSSLASLRRLRIDTLKIDRSFVRRLSSDPDAALVASAVIDMAASLGIDVVAEGIESEQEFAFLRDRKCRAGQGFLLGSPIPASDFARMLGADGRIIASEQGD